MAHIHRFQALLQNTAAKPMQRMKAAGSEPPHVDAGTGRAGRTSKQQLRGSESSEPAREVDGPIKFVAARRAWFWPLV